MDSGRVATQLALAFLLSACAFLVDFDELQDGAAEPEGGAGETVEGGSSNSEGGRPSGGSGVSGGTEASGGSEAGGGGESSGGSSTGGTTAQGGADDEGGAPPSGGDAGSSVGGGSAGTDPGIALEDSAAAVAEALCAKMEVCLGAAAMELVFFDEDCRQLAESVLDNTLVASVEASVAAGKLEYDGTALPACLAAYETLPCGQVTVAFPDDCKQALGGLSPEGDTCDHALECEAGLYCDRASCSCAVTLTEGEPCGPTETCEPGLVCFEESCQPLGDSGDDCGAGLLPECLTGLLCLGGDEAMADPGTCFEASDLFVLSEGQNCNVWGDPPSLCREGLSCTAGLFGGTCVTPVSSGGECQATIPDMCPPGERCASGLCTPLPAPGENCLIFTYPVCEPYSRCVGGVCRRTGNNGNTCIDPAECYSQFCSDGLCSTQSCL